MRRFLLAGVVAALLVSGCASDPGEKAAEDPKGTLTQALEAMAEAPGNTVTITVRSDVSSLQAMAAEEEGGELSAEDAQKILDSSLTISANSPDDPKDARAAVSVNVGGIEDAFEMRNIGMDLYVRADVPALADLFGAPAGALDQARGFGQQAGLTFIDPALDGEWLAIKGLDKLAEGLTGQPMPTATSSADAAALKEFTAAVKDLATVTSAGEDEVGSHLVATLPIRKLYERFVSYASDLKVPLGASMLPPASEVPDENLKVDIWVADDRVTQVEFDFLQLEAVFDEPPPEGMDNLAIRLALAEFDGEVEVPADAVEVDPQQIFQSLMGVSGMRTESEFETKN